MSENAKAILGAIILAVIMFGSLWLWKGLTVAILVCAVYFAGWLYSPPRFWKVLLFLFKKIMQLFGFFKQ